VLSESDTDPASLQARELSSLTGADVLLLISSEMGNVYDFSTAKFGGVLTKCKVIHLPLFRPTTSCSFAPRACCNGAGLS
jgi:hypothetical protein